ncbi:collectin-11-like [Drosophila subpulchrella]|uniref:collectin-11-like n=1 Tax=Drosophila subpulchrella TaxID=1486046 RepID=UPI0018A17232|nr:collectin-11-like [Drosophila subpulchrella]
MFKEAISFSIVILAWTSYGAQAKSLDADLSTFPQDPANKLMVKVLPLLDHIAKQSKCNVFDDLDTTLEVKQKDIADRLIAIQKQQKDFQNTIASLQESLKKIPEVFERKENIQKDVQAKIETQQAKLMDTVSEIYNKVFWPKFQRIGSRLFYIDSESSRDWFEAGKKCREMGGYIASIKDQEELVAITAKLDDKRYWLGINNRDNHEIYVSEASGKKNPFLKWRPKEPNNAKKNEYCVELDNGGMNDHPCSESRYLICQSDNEV